PVLPRVGAVEGEQRAVKIGPSVAEHAPIRAHLADRVEIERRRDDFLVRAARFGGDKQFPNESAGDRAARGRFVRRLA
ncbi:MAG: hypothetical protein WD715_08500, partial [Dongiaceae bacterium]